MHDIKSLSFISTLFVTAGGIAHADTTLRDSMPAIDGGLELGLAVGAATSVGDVGDGMAAEDLIGTSAQLELKVGHRVTPNLAINFYAAAQSLSEGSTRSRDVSSGSAGVMADFHFRPRTAIDPWIGIGTGVSGILVEQDGDDSLAVGVELARVQLGVDFRVNEDFAIGPMIGASASLYGALKTPMADFAEIDDKGINWTFSAGVAGRFNAFGTRK